MLPCCGVRPIARLTDLNFEADYVAAKGWREMPVG
jgi:hypothetical protein